MKNYLISLPKFSGKPLKTVRNNIFKIFNFSAFFINFQESVSVTEFMKVLVTPEYAWYA